MLVIQSLTKSYSPEKKAVDDLSLTIEDGDIYGFIGHNGAGKTTTLKSITGIIPFESGTVTFNGIDLNKQPELYKSNIAYIPDNPDLYENMTGIKYINFLADVFSVSQQDRDTLIPRYADAFELTGNLGSPISSYSHGMKQKLALIAAFVHKPRLLILDEPFVGLDPKAAYTLKEFMRELCAGGGSIFFSTHVLEVAEKLCNKIAIIKEGRLVRSGLIDDVRGDSTLENLFLELV
ncbi:MAG: ABC transporter ATP-binding protein [Clostridia bacterium]|nr:ABC transporter ATP-binding protein [Clostridia bacterium]MBO7666602.1 ABC transporter ATP-binding protein [Clostridia bacterium]MBP5238407.1 ABC transporter ATP-binding protein [Clostridia bacterium]MBP5658275.1 ABC transporter ATP-binding protein [Clostridia bacterium]MBP5754765.1 ABC transporter ATP-binding protein [Clostridia bacterium]